MNGPTHAVGTALARRFVRTALLLMAAVMLWACASMRQASFAMTEPGCMQNLVACGRRCEQDPRLVECQVIAVRLGEETVAKGTVTALAPPALLGLHARLAVICNDGIIRACAADQELAPVYAKAEADAQGVRKEAQKVTDARAATVANQQSERDACMAAANDCDAKGDTFCKGKCDGGEAPYCEVWGLNLWKREAPKLADARATMTKSCSGGVQIACGLVPQIDADIQGLWSAVQEIGDNLASNKFEVATVLRVNPTVRNQRDAEVARTIEASVLAKRYCPARQAFIQRVGAGEFRKRATAHCTNDPPTAQGLSGAQVQLGEQCTTVYATSCS